MVCLWLPPKSRGRPLRTLTPPADPVDPVDPVEPSISWFVPGANDCFLFRRRCSISNVPSVSAFPGRDGSGEFLPESTEPDDIPEDRAGDLLLLKLDFTTKKVTLRS